MPLNLEGKKAIVADVAEVANSALSAVVADYRGLTVAQMTDLRRRARDTGVYLRVVRNTLAKRALQDTDFACMEEIFVGPTIIGFAKDEPGSAARLFKSFAKENDKLEVKALSISGQLYGGHEIDRLASLPTRDEALSQLLAVMKAPISKFVRTLAEPHGKLVRTIAAVRDKKQAEG